MRQRLRLVPSWTQAASTPASWAVMLGDTEEKGSGQRRKNSLTGLCFSRYSGRLAGLVHESGTQDLSGGCPSYPHPHSWTGCMVGLTFHIILSSLFHFLVLATILRGTSGITEPGATKKDLGSECGFGTAKLCDLRQVPSPLWASIAVSSL